MHPHLRVTEKRNRIASVATFAVLVTGLIVGVIIALPLLSHMHTHLLESGERRFELRAQSFAQIFDRYREIAALIAGSREPARLFMAWQQETDGRAALNSRLAATLAEQVSQFDEVAAVVRVDQAGNEVLRVGARTARLPGRLAENAGIDFVSLPANASRQEVMWLRLDVPVVTAAGQLIGEDRVFFYPDAVQALFLADADTDTSLCLFNIALDRHVKLDALSGRLVAGAARDCLSGIGVEDFSSAVQTFRHESELGVSRITFFQTLPGTDWSLRAQTRASVLFEDLHRQLMLAALTLLALMLLTSLLARRLISPMLHQLVRQAAQIEEATAELRLSASVFENSQDAMLITTPDGRVVRANPGFTRLVGLNIERLPGCMLDDLLDAQRNRENLLDHINQRLVVDAAWQGEIWYQHVHGQAIPVMQTVSVVRDETGEPVHLIHVFNDLSERMRAEQHLKRLAHHDKLTALPNRLSLEQHLAQSILYASQQSGRFALMFLDLDRFKPVNDTFGHDVGDMLLQRVAQRLHRVVRATDIVGRQGGDEFLLITSEIAASQDCDRIAEKIIATLSKPYEVQSHLIEIGVSIGIAIYPDNGSTVETLLKQADRAMYRAKESGNGGYAHSPPADGHS